MEDLIHTLGRELEARHRRASQTPRVLYEAWRRPFTVGITHAGEVTVVRDGAYYGSTGREFRSPTGADLQAIQAVETELAAVQQRLRALLTRVWTRARLLDVDDLAEMGARDLR
jgi:hypothetical protein